MAMAWGKYINATVYIFKTVTVFIAILLFYLEL